jgi:invasion protein IalB
MLLIFSWPRLAATLTLCVALTAVAWAQGSEKFGAWTTRCETAHDQVEGGCFIYQNLVLREGGQRVLQFAVGFVNNTPEPVALLSLPLGISLPPGVTLRVDAGASATLTVERCEPDGCRAGLKLQTSLLQQLKTGEKVTVSFHDAERKVIEVPLSLVGFSAGLASLKGQSGN